MVIGIQVISQMLEELADFCTGVSRADWENFKLDFKGERNKTRLTGGKAGNITPVVEKQCPSKVFWSAVSVEVEGGDPCGSKDKRTIDVLETTDGPENGHVGIRVPPPQKGVRINSPFEVHLHQCTQRGQQTRGASPVLYLHWWSGQWDWVLP